MLAHTTSRKQRAVNSSQNVDLTHEAARTKKVELSLPGFKKMVNGKLAKNKCQHHCDGCCIDRIVGQYSRTQAVFNFFTAINSIGIFGPFGHIAISIMLSSFGSCATRFQFPMISLAIVSPFIG